MPVPQMPGWWVWLAYLNPCYWTIYGLVASQVNSVPTSLMRNQGTHECAGRKTDLTG